MHMGPGSPVQRVGARAHFPPFCSMNLCAYVYMYISTGGEAALHDAWVLRARDIWSASSHPRPRTHHTKYLLLLRFLSFLHLLLLRCRRRLLRLRARRTWRRDSCGVCKAQASGANFFTFYFTFFTFYFTQASGANSQTKHSLRPLHDLSMTSL